MRRSALLLLTLPWEFMVSSQGFSLVTSSRFSMVLWPTNEELDVAASTSVENAVEASLIRSSTTSRNFDSLFDVDIVLLQVEWFNSTFQTHWRNPNTTLLFEAHAKFFTDKPDLSPTPSKFALDSFVARTFSQPSSKNAFLDDLSLVQKKALDTIDDVEIEIVLDDIPEDEVSSANNLSGVDIILICASALIFLGMIFIVYQSHKESEDLTDRRSRALREWHRTHGVSVSASPSGEKVGILDGETSSDKGTGPSPNRDSIGVQDYVAEESSQESPEPSMFQANIEYTDDSDEEENVESQRNGGPLRSPPVSNGSSVHSSPVGKASTVDSPVLSFVSSQVNQSIPSSPYRLGAPPASYPAVDECSVASSDVSPLTARLLRLPNMDSPGGSSKHSGVSPESAPTIMLKISQQKKKASSAKMSSARSLGPFQPRLSTPWIQAAESRESTTDITEIALASSRTERTVNSENHHFKEDWDISKKRAMEEDMDGIDEDVFGVEIDARSNAVDGESRMSGLSAVSEWLKSIRVVGTPENPASPTTTSQTSDEHSSVEPKSPGKEEASVDGSISLERSLAASIDIERI